MDNNSSVYYLVNHTLHQINVYDRTSKNHQYRTQTQQMSYLRWTGFGYIYGTGDMSETESLFEFRREGIIISFSLLSYYENFKRILKKIIKRNCS